MILTCKPCGKGNWKVVTILISGDRVLPILFNIGEKIQMGGMMLRIHKISL